MRPPNTYTNEHKNNTFIFDINMNYHFFLSFKVYRMFSGWFFFILMFYPNLKTVQYTCISCVYKCIYYMFAMHLILLNILWVYDNQPCSIVLKGGGAKKIKYKMKLYQSSTSLWGLGFVQTYKFINLIKRYFLFWRQWRNCFLPTILSSWCYMSDYS